MNRSRALNEQAFRDQSHIAILTQMLTLAGYPPKSQAWEQLRERAMRQIHQDSADTVIAFYASLPSAEQQRLRAALDKQEDNEQ